MSWSRYKFEGIRWDGGVSVRFVREKLEKIDKGNAVSFLCPESFQQKKVWGKCLFRQGRIIRFPWMTRTEMSPVLLEYEFGRSTGD
jgi:hypothetical protein